MLPHRAGAKHVGVDSVPHSLIVDSNHMLSESPHKLGAKLRVLCHKNKIKL